jgi:hypothetical protein
MNRNENETESFAGNFAASEQRRLFFEVPLRRKGARFRRFQACPKDLPALPWQP